MSYRYSKAKPPLKLLQINVGKGGTNHESALTRAFEEKIDILLIQEPYLFSDLQRRITKRHPSYECFSPTDDWSIRPRVLTYLRKGVGLQAEQLRPLSSNNIASGDLLFLSLKSASLQSILITNVYNAPIGALNEGAAIKALLSLPNNFFPLHSLLAGDFNLHHHRWQPSYPYNTTAAEPFVDWMDNLGLDLTTKADTPTHKLGNTLDLVLASNPLLLLGTESATARQLNISSDHYPIQTWIPWDARHQEPLNRLKPDTLQPDLLKSLLQTKLQGLPGFPANPQPTELDKAAQSLVTAIREAYQGAAQRSTGQNSGVSWWNKDCREAVQKFRASDQTKEDIKIFRRAVRRVKREHYGEQLNKASTTKEVFGMMKWHKSTGSYRSPPMKDPSNPDGPLATTLADKRDILLRHLLQEAAEVGDIPLDSPTAPATALPFPEITSQEISKAILGVGSTTPGEDEITTTVLKAGWILLERPITALFRSCLAIGHHPQCFKTAIAAILSKPNKPDRSSPRAYRPIALLSVLGKGLERLVAKRMSWIAVVYKVLPKQQFGALPLRSAVDLTTCLAHEVETALNSKLTASLLTLDVKGAFNAVLPGRLICRLREQGWPHSLVQWIASFATDRKARIRLDGSIGALASLDWGLPQGSPISPILFMLYIAPLLFMGTPKLRFAYADDIALLRISTSLTENATALSKDLEEALNWGAAEENHL